jgi:CO/xanthine dehydrogenase FAD-binding subunit
MKGCEYFQPESLEEALSILARPGSPPTILAGGTDVMVWVQSGRFVPTSVLDIWKIRGECSGINTADDHIAIGSLATYQEIIQSPVVQEFLPLLNEASREVGAAQIQNRGTLGGNIGGSSPAGDTLPVLLAYDATIVLVSQSGRREVPYNRFCLGYRKTAQRQDELIAEIKFPKPGNGRFEKWYKVGTRLAQAISKVMVAGIGEVDHEGRVSFLRIAAGSVGPVPLLLEEVIRQAVGNRIDEGCIESAKKAVIVDISPIDDVRSTAFYRAQVTQNLVVRFLEDLARETEV